MDPMTSSDRVTLRNIVLAVIAGTAGALVLASSCLGADALRRAATTSGDDRGTSSATGPVGETESTTTTTAATTDTPSEPNGAAVAGPSGGASSSAETSGATDNASAGEADGRDATAVSPPPARVFTSLPPATAPPANGINALDAGVAETERARAERERADQEAARASAANADAGFEIRPRATAPPQGSPFATQAPWWGASSFVSDPNAGAGQFTAPRVNEASAFQSDPNSGAGRFTTEWPPFGGYIESPLVSVPVQPQSSGTGQ